ncbi:early transcribed membrane protein, putative [Plasmodium knowlesi strain H]|uniref:Early transcribed membrane protein, putative n=3 Tax=Plasmodium knowlesi TaxID=5850 RepID=A0A5E7X637_PLAKH|nr:early transcribed membrane protein [Plasmodium knowlesi strain H]OTN65615.1 putative Early transcribed membrane protein [Plasmodium knowlesi]CAA9989789.1 early transcribed membrane protein [Plasmodium knowlesi strain H]SBO22914.1 early transcribed membrane protein, putative [Plasmodium knowlesi strain H]SBO22983.1 early transcribed membrane protein, putative [Plasmodium knowlesi strain H]VVS79263.1 early transcribed membrane protein [Plasmodium knowlesi strain H]
MKISNVYIFIFIFFFNILFEPHLCNAVIQRNESHLIKSPIDELNRKRKKKVLYAIIGVTLGMLAVVAGGLGMIHKRKKPSIWDDLGQDANGILNSTIAQGIWMAKMNMTKDTMPVDKLLPQMDDIRKIIKQELAHRRLDIDKYDPLQIQDFCNFSIFNIKESMLSFQRNLRLGKW